MRKWYNGNRCEVLNKRKAITKPAVVNEVTNATDCLRQLILFHFALEKLRNVVNI